MLLVDGRVAESVVGQRLDLTLHICPGRADPLRPEAVDDFVKVHSLVGIRCGLKGLEHGILKVGA